MRVIRQEDRNVKSVAVEFSRAEVEDMIKHATSVHFGFPKQLEALLCLKVEFNDKHGAQVYGDVPLTREQLLESLGLTPTEPAKTVDTQAAFSEADLESFKRAAHAKLKSSPYDPTAHSLLRVVAALRGEPVTEMPRPPNAPDLVVPEFPACTVSDGHGRPLDPATLSVGAVCTDLSAVVFVLEQATYDSVGSILARASEAKDLVLALQSTLLKYRDCVLVEGRSEPLVPRRGPSDSELTQARARLAAMYEQVTRTDAKPRAVEVAQIYKLLGGGDL